MEAAGEREMCGWLKWLGAQMNEIICLVLFAQALHM